MLSETRKRQRMDRLKSPMKSRLMSRLIHQLAHQLKRNPRSQFQLELASYSDRTAGRRPAHIRLE